MNKNIITGLALSGVFAVLCACSATKAGAPATGIVAKSFVSGTPTVIVSHRLPQGLKDMPEFRKMRVRDWRENYDLFAAALVQKAAESGLDSASLSQALKATLAAPESNGVALLPVAAYSTFYQGAGVWQIDLRWEGAGAVLRDEPMSHVRTHYFTRDEIKQVGFSTCD
jgi:hypothetical protein